MTYFLRLSFFLLACARTNFRIAVLTAVLSPGLRADSTPEFQVWISAVAEQRAHVAGVAAGQQAMEAKQRLQALGKTHPVPTDWVLQDVAPQGYHLLLPAQATATETALLQKLGAPTLPNDSASRLTAYLKLCEQRRQKRLAPLLQQWAPLVFTEGHSIIHSFIGYTEGLSDARAERFFEPGARLTRLSFDEDSSYGNAEHLFEDPQGMMRDVDASYDKNRLLFAWKKSDRLDDYHIYEYDLQSGTERQLTRGLGRADYEPAYLPDGDIVFASTRPEQSVPCWWTEISNLYRMSPDGQYIRRLAVDQVHTLYPQVLNNGRICYTRWDYSDRGQNYPHPVFSMDPDGQAQRVYYGGNSWFPTSLLHTRAIPGSSKVMSIAAGHHTKQHGKLVILDVNEGRDEGVGMHFVAPKREVPYERVDVAQQKGDQFRYPFPLSEEELLVSYMPDWGLRDLLSAEERKTNHRMARYRGDLNEYGLYWMNTDGEREYLYADETLGVQRMVALGHRPTQPVMAPTVDYTKKTGTLYVHDVYKGVGLKGVPRGEAKTMRVVRLNYRAAGVGHNANHGEGGGSLNSTPVSVGNATWDIKEILGDADIHADGSSLFEVPADESIYLQVLNSKGQVIQTTRTWDTVKPGEQKACTGCHDKTNANHYPYKKENTLAWKQGVQKLRPFYGETRGFSFQKEIQPMLDTHCVACHDGTPEVPMDLRGTLLEDAQKNARKWSQSYINLTGATRRKHGDYVTDNPEGGFVTWISKMSRPTELPPYFSGAAKSPLINMLETGHHGVTLSEEEHHKLAAWMDLLVPYAGTYREAHHWSETHMQFYDYFEGKRDQQAQEEILNIQAFLRSLGNTDTTEPGEAAAFTRAVYQPVWQSQNLQLSAGKPHPLPGDDAFRFDRMSFEAAPDRPVTVELRQRNKVVHTFTLSPEQPRITWQPGGKTLTSQGFSITSDMAIILSAVEAHGIRERDMPEVNGYRRHLSY